MTRGSDERQEIFEQVTAVTWATIDEFYEALTQAGYWDEDAEFAGIVRDRKERLRKQIQGARDERGRPRFESISEPGTDGKAVQRYKQIAMLNLDEFKQAINTWAKRARHAMGRIIMLQQQAHEIHGEQIPMPLEVPDSFLGSNQDDDDPDDDIEQPTAE